MTLRRFVWIAAAALLAPAGGLVAQVKVTGGLTMYGELYDRSMPLAARPDRTGRITANLTIDFLNGLFTVPLTALIATDGVQFRQQINQVGISPTYRSVTVHLGTFTPDYSRYTFTDATLTGGGFVVRRPGFRVGAVAGRTRRALIPDTTNLFIPGDFQFAQHAFGGQVGFGSREGSFVDLYMLAAEDDRNSLDTAITNNVAISAEQNMVIALKGRAALAGGRVTFEAEAANTRFDPNSAVSAKDVQAQAANAKLLYNAPTWSLGGTIEYLGEGFRTFGNSGLAADRMDYGLTGRVQLGSRIQLSGMGGWRQDNLSDALDATTTQAIFNLAASWQPVPAFGLDLQAANNVNNSRAKDDTSSVKNITGQYGVTPHVVWRTGAAQHVLVVSANQQRSENTTPGSVALADTKATTLLATWTMSFPSSLTFTAVATRTQVDVDSLRTAITTLQPGVSYAVFAQKLQVTVQAQFTTTKPPSGGTDREVFPLAQLRYAVARGQSLQLRSSVRHVTGVSTASFDERVVTLQYAATWR